MLQESTHLPVGISPFQIGWSAVAVNLSNIAAMGARPYAFTIAMGIPAHTETALRDVDLRELAFFYGGDYELLFTVAADVFTDEFAKRQKKSWYQRYRCGSAV
jgi:thiamine monophosphate kinase